MNCDVEIVMNSKLESINKDEAFRYMGYGSSIPERQTLELADDCEKKLLSVINARYTYRYFEIDKNNTSKECVALNGTSLSLCGSSISGHLEGCEGVVLFAVTLSDGVDRLIRQLSVKSMSAAVVADSLASAAVEQVCDIAEREIMKEFEGRYTTWRFSPGYGDFPLETQHLFLDVLSAQKRIGVNITGGGLMTPCKSVTAVIGISNNEVERKRRGCSVCRMKDTCRFRKKGEHCGF